jgi:hypothetical protein
MNDCLDSGTQIPFIKWGITNGYGVIVANTNINTVKEDNTKKKIRVGNAMRVLMMMVNSSININKSNNHLHLKSSIKKTPIFIDKNLGLAWERLKNVAGLNQLM